MDIKVGDLFISPEITIKMALKKMNSINKRLLIVVVDGKYHGLLSIGDIQRALISSATLETVINGIVKTDGLVASIYDDVESIKKLMVRHRIEVMPVVNKERIVVDAVFWDDLFAEGKPRGSGLCDIPVVIMAGGEGTRLRPLTYVIPKALVPVREKPILHEIVDGFIEQGAKEFYFTVNYKKDLIRNYFSQLGDIGASIEYLEEDRPRGTAGSLSFLAGHVDRTFIVTNCDIIIEQDYSDILAYHRKNKNEITLVSALKIESIPYGILHSGENGLLTAIEEKPDFSYQINAGFYILEPHLLDSVPRDKVFHITELIEGVLGRKGRVGVFPISKDSWWDMGEWTEYWKMQRHMTPGKK